MITLMFWWSEGGGERKGRRIRREEVEAEVGRGGG